MSDREREVIILRAMGLSMQEAADELGLAIKTIRNYQYQVAYRLGTSNILETLIELGVLVMHPDAY